MNVPGTIWEAKHTLIKEVPGALQVAVRAAQQGKTIKGISYLTYDAGHSWEDPEPVFELPDPTVQVRCEMEGRWYWLIRSSTHLNPRTANFSYTLIVELCTA